MRILSFIVVALILLKVQAQHGIFPIYSDKSSDIQYATYPMQTALLFSERVYTGSAKAMGLGYAMGAVGGDLSLTSYNPAALSVLNHSTFTITPSISTKNNDLSIVNTSDVNSTSRWIGSLDNIAIGVKLPTYSETFSYYLGFSLNQIADYDNTLAIEYSNPVQSQSPYIRGYNNLGGSSLGMTDEFFDVAWHDSTKFMIYGRDTLTAPFGVPDNQVSFIRLNGEANSYEFTFALNYDRKFYIGGSIGFTTLSYSFRNTLTETSLVGKYADELRYQENTSIAGRGINFSLGTIYVPTPFLRLALALHSPTFYDMSELTTYAMEYDIDDEFEGYDSPEYQYQYKFETPSRILAGFALMAPKRAFFSFDAEFVFYPNATFSEGVDGEEFYEENEVVANQLQNTTNLRFGIEYLFSSKVFGRLGVQSYGSPYNLPWEGSGFMGFLSPYRSMLSAGLGLNTSERFTLDIAYTYSASNYRYLTIEESTSSPVEVHVNTKKHHLSFGVTYRF